VTFKICGFLDFLNLRVSKIPLITISLWTKYRPNTTHKGSSRGVKFKKIKFLQNMKVYIVWMTSVFFLSAECENFSWKRGDKVRGEKNCFWFFFLRKWFRKDYKDDPGRNFCLHNIFHHFSGVESWGWNFFIWFFSRKWFTRDYEDDLCRNFCCHNIFSPLFGGLEFGGEIFYSIFLWKWFTMDYMDFMDYKDDVCRSFCCQNIFHPFLGVKFWGEKFFIRFFFVKIVRYGLQRRSRKGF